MAEHTYNIYEAKTQFSKLLEAVEAGEDVTICRRGQPIAKLTAVPEKSAKSPWGAMAHLRPDCADDPDYDPTIPKWTDEDFDEMGL
jgi:prevent-host-death family protein